MASQKIHLQEKYERNTALYEDWVSGKYRLAELVAKYRISHARIYGLLAREKARRAAEGAA